jgi:hypothetical protein
MNNHLSKTLPSLVEHLHWKQAPSKFTFEARRGGDTLLRGGFSRLTSSGGGGDTSSGSVGGCGSTSSGSAGGGGGTSSGSAGGGGGTSSLPSFLDGSLDTMRLLEEGEALGFASWWLETMVLGFSWCRGWRSSCPARIYIDKMANRQAVGHTPRNPCPLRRALGHKNHVVTRRRVTVHILLEKPNTQLLLWVARFLKIMNCSYFY